MSQESHPVVEKVFLVPGLPHVLLSPERSPGWQALRAAYAQVAAEIEECQAELIVYLSTQWLSVLGYMFQGRNRLLGVHVDENWHELGTMRYDFRVDTDFASACTATMRRLGFTSKAVDYEGFPIDTGTIVADTLLNPKRRRATAMVSCNLYADATETERLGRVCAEVLAEQQKKAIVVLVSALSHRFHVDEIDPATDTISTPAADAWNRRLLGTLAEGALAEAVRLSSAFARDVSVDMGLKGLAWLAGMAGRHNQYRGHVYEYQPVWGCGAALVRLDPPDAMLGAPIGPIKPARHGHDRQVISTDLAPAPVGPYPHARREGGLLFVSGMGPRRRGSKEIPGVQLNETGEILAYDIGEQTRAVFTNLQSILAAAGCSLADVVDVQVFLTNIAADFAAFNKVYGEYFNAASGPTRTTVEVARLPTPIAVELKVIARAPSGS